MTRWPDHKKPHREGKPRYPTTSPPRYLTDQKTIPCTPHFSRDGGSDLTLWMMEEEYAIVMAVSSLSPVRIQTCMLQTANQRLHQEAESIKHLARGRPRVCARAANDPKYLECYKYQPQPAWCTARHHSHPALRRYCTVSGTRSWSLSSTQVTPTQVMSLSIEL